MLLYLFTLAFLVPLSFTVYPQDEIKFSDLGQSFYLKNETYVFQLLPGPQVPLNIIDHVIYTASSAEITSLTKRTLFEKRHQLLEFSEMEHDHLARLLYENEVHKVPSYIKRNQMKRSVGMQDGVVVIPLTKEGHSLLLYDPKELRNQRKREVQDDIPIGTTFCLHLFWTMCPNDDGTTEIKNALNGATTEMWAELDSTKTTNNQRSISLANTLEAQKDILDQLVQYFIGDNSGIVTLVSKVAEQESINAVNMAFGDQVVQAQIDYLKRTVNSLLRYTNALAGTDPRQVMAQPSLTELFTGFLSVLNYLTINPGGFIPIIEVSTFNWTEIPLPQDVVHNTAYPPDSYVLWDTSQPGTSLSYPGFQVNLQSTCNINQVTDQNGCRTSISDCMCNTQISYNTFATVTGYFYGPIPMNMVGIYNLLLNGNPMYPSLNIVSSVYDDTKLVLTDWTSGQPSSLVWYCVQFGPYKGLATFTETPYMMNGIPLNSPPLNISECNSMMLMSTPQNVENTIYSLYVVYNNVVIPFFSNCTAETIIIGNFTNTIQSLGYLSQYPRGYSYSLSNNTYPIPNSNDFLTQTDVFEYHMISAECSINLEPEWIGMEYWFTTQDTVIANIPTGFKLNQFTINPVGQLSSSLEFVYTSSWVTTYYIQRISNNRIITDEIDLLDGDQLLFIVSSNMSFVIDESNNFYGAGNNGRDCIQKADSYLYDLTSCIFQNDLVDYDANNYFKGLVQTSGIARYVNKFDFSVSENSNGASQYTFSLVPQDQADFNFYFQPDGTICPKLVFHSSDVSGCSFTFWFNGTGAPQFNSLPLHFVNGVASPTTGFGLFSLTIGNPAVDCMLVYCQFSAKYSTIKFEPPPYTVVAASDLALQAQVYTSIDTNMNGTLSNLQDVSLTANSLIPQFQNLSKRLSEINFNVSVLYPYQDFTKQREQVTAMINNLTSESGAPWAFPPIGCDEIFSGLDCFFKNIGGIIITVCILVGVLAGIYCLCYKMGLYKIIMKKLFG